MNLTSPPTKHFIQLSSKAFHFSKLSFKKLNIYKIGSKYKRYDLLYVYHYWTKTSLSHSYSFCHFISVFSLLPGL